MTRNGGEYGIRVVALITADVILSDFLILLSLRKQKFEKPAVRFGESHPYRRSHARDFPTTNPPQFLRGLNSIEAA